MNPEVKEYLFLFTEVAIATVALSEITMVLAISGKRLTVTSVNQIATQLRMAFYVTLFSILPLLLDQLQLEPAYTWRITSAV